MITNQLDNHQNQKQNRKLSDQLKNSLERQIPIILAGTEAVFQHNLRGLLYFCNLSNSWQLNIVGEAINQQQMLTLAKEKPNSLILLDWDSYSGEKEGIKTLMELRKLANNTRVLVISERQEDNQIFRIMQAGAFGYLLKEDLPSQLHTAIITLSKGQVYLCPEVTTKFFRMFHCYEGRTLLNSNNYNLTQREQEVLQLLIEGACNQTIAQNLFITVATVKAHLTAIFEKLGVDSRAMAIVKALKAGLV